ncbi:MAG: hypothetical protein R6V85_08660 [Polyangia bacterium]
MKSERLLMPILAAMLAAGLCGCSDDDDAGSGGDADSDADADADTDADTDADGDADCSSCTAPVCIESISGRVLFDDETPFEGNVQICAVNCYVESTDQGGEFLFEIPGGCMGFDFSSEEAIHVTLLDEEGHARYSAAYEPTQQEVSDGGQNDFDFDSGDQIYWALPDESASYTAAGGATVDGLFGVSFEAAAGDLGDEDFEIRVLEAPLDQWAPPFAPPGVDLDALYYLAPYFQPSAAGLELEIDAAAAGWSGTDAGTVYMLGDYVEGEYLHCGGEEVAVGKMVGCGSAAHDQGKIVTDPISRLGWIGLARD